MGAVVPVDASNTPATVPAVDAAAAGFRAALGRTGPPILAVLVLVVAASTVAVTEAALEGPAEVGSAIGLDTPYLPEAETGVRPVAEAMLRPEARKGDVRPT